MTVRRLAIGFLIVIGLAVPVVANVAPTMADQYVVTGQSVPVTFELRATDEDIDPLNGEGHPLTFVVVTGPQHGVLVGDLGEVDYQSPHDGVVKVTYAPAQGFVGTDLVVVSVEDPYGETASGTTTIRIEVQAQQDLGLLSGTWDANLTYDVQSGEFTVFQSSITEVYRIDHLTLSGTAGWKLETQSGSKTFVFDVLRFRGDVDIWDINIDTTLEFDPDAAAAGGSLFDYWRTSTTFPLLGLHLGHTLYLTVPQTESYQLITAQGSVGSFGVGTTIRFDLDEDCGFGFSRNDTYVSWRLCDIRMRATTSFTCEGFQQAKLSLSKIPVPLFSWIPPGVTLDFSLTFEPEEKSFSASLGWQPQWMDCLKIMAELGTSTLTYPAGSAESIASIDLYGFKVECELESGARFVSATSLHPDYNSRVTGLTDYFEVVRLSVPLGGCCDIPGYLGLATYFYGDSTWLFDWGMTTASFDLGLSEQVSLSFDFVAHSGELTNTDPWVELSFGWTVRW